MRAIAFALCTTGLLAACDAPPETPFIPPTQVIAVDTPPPEYPLEVACEGVGGKVQLFVTIGTEGTVTGAQMRQTSGQPLLPNPDLVPRLQLPVRLRPAPVHADLARPHEFVDQRPRRPLQLPEQEVVQALAGAVVRDPDLPSAGARPGGGV